MGQRHQGVTYLGIAEAARQDPYSLQQYGEVWAQLQAAIALADQAAEQI